jgi:hypothetical protein
VSLYLLGYLDDIGFELDADGELARCIVQEIKREGSSARVWSGDLLSVGRILILDVGELFNKGDER